ncbi:MAG: hypothetical protein GF347_03135 [Candidatus Moranbacteria bacterium]|nr:hypothetical protein [Candidatus Moranbacteria bacterium]
MQSAGVVIGHANLHPDEPLTMADFGEWVVKNSEIDGESIFKDLVFKVKEEDVIKHTVLFGERDEISENIPLHVSGDMGEDTRDIRVRFINDMLLDMCGATWEKPFPVLSINIHKGVMKLLKSLIFEYNTLSDVWGTNDCRVMSTLNVWLDGLRDFGNDVAVVFIYRHPMAVAKGARHDITGVNEPHADWDIQRGLDMWKAHNLILLDLLGFGFRKILVKYEDFAKDSEVERISGFLGREVENPFDKAMCHNEGGVIPADCVEIYNRLEEAHHVFR